MPGFGDYALIALIALILFGPKKLPELARQLGKLMGEFRRASNEFRMQMEEEIRVADRAEQQKKIEALEAAAPPPVTGDTPLTTLTTDITVPVTGSETEAAPAETIDLPEHPAIARSGELTMHPPETGLPVAQSAEVTQALSEGATASDAMNALADSIPVAKETPTHG